MTSRQKGEIPVKSRIPGLAAVIGAAALLLPGSAVSVSPQQNELVGSVGPGFTISLTRDGARVTHLDPGTYTVTINDRSIEHNFHLSGPGVDMSTEVEFSGTATWTVTLSDGIYHFQCDPHSGQMNGDFAVGSATLPPPPQPPAPAPKAKKLTGTVGPGFTISLKSGAKKVKTLKAGAYKITVRDKSTFHNFHLTGAGVSKATRVPFRGNRTWTVRFRKGKTYRFRCDPHPSQMKGSFRAT
jgi:plastocyanin